MSKNLYKDKINKGKSCRYCFDNKVHKAFEKEGLCVSCASDVVEDFKDRIEKHNETKG